MSRPSLALCSSGIVRARRSSMNMLKKQGESPETAADATRTADAARAAMCGAGAPSCKAPPCKTAPPWPVQSDGRYIQTSAPRNKRDNHKRDDTEKPDPPGRPEHRDRQRMFKGQGARLEAGKRLERSCGDVPKVQTC